MENEGSPSVVENESSGGMRGWIESMVITVSQTYVGQTLFKLLDSFLWVVEKSAQWSLPSHEIAAEENGKVFGKIELVRPLPWVLFLPGLVILRIIRVGLNVGAFVLGHPRIQPSGMVKFVQKSRRRLRALNLKVVKSSRHTNKVATPDEKSTTESTGSPIHTKIKRKFSQVSSDDDSTDEESENETLQSKLDKLALEDSTDDPDFNPTECCTESSSTSSENEIEKEVSLSEIIEVQEETNKFLTDHEGEHLIISHQNLKTNSTKDDETTAEPKQVDSSETKLETVSRLTNDFINGEINSTIDPPPPVLPEATPAPEVIDKVVTKKQPAPVPTLGQPRNFYAKENYPTIPERKGGKYKKSGRRDTK